ncbi:MAG: lysozyme [Beijerinckiaceae bacterium]
MNARIVVASLSLSAAAFVALVASEGYTDRAVIPTKGDVPTVGFGSTTGVKMGDTTTPVRAIQRAAKELDTVYEAAIKRCAPVPMHQAEYDVYVDMTYNIGVSAFCGSTMARKLREGDYIEACNQILQWKRAAGYDCSTPGNKRCWGLWERRLALHAQCMGVQ